MPIKALFFDIGGVVCYDIEKAMMKEIAEKYNLPYEEVMNIRSTWWQLYATNKISEKEYWKGLLRDLKIEADPHNFLALPYKKYILPMEGMLPLLSILKKKYPLYVISDHSREWWAYAEKKYALKEYFQDTVISYQYGILKSAGPKLFKIALQKASVQAEEALFIDNAEENLHVAKKLGMHTLLFTTRETFQEDVKRLHMLK
ncbi:MAG: HAD-IA family hydrolase [bacterium]|nr:HAD-IA family hydrolase [bacterium]